jgi:hypothetical protein
MDGKPVEDFQPPKGTEADFVNKKVCLDTGLLATAYCLRTRVEVFKKETAPTKLCTMHNGGASLSGGESSPGDNGGTQPSSDLLEMGAPAVVKSNPTPGATPEEDENTKAAPTTEGYPDEGF